MAQHARNQNKRKAEEDLRYDNILFIMDIIENIKTKQTIMTKTKILKKTIAKIDKYWDDHPQWRTNYHESKIMGNLLKQLDRKSNNFMDCFPKTIVQKDKVNKNKVTLILAVCNIDIYNINKILKLLEAMIQIDNIVRPIRIMLNWNNILKKLETF